jgi:hypothetical protein
MFFINLFLSYQQDKVMRVIAFINWVFILVVVSYLGYNNINGLDRSYDNNYFKFESDSTAVFPESAKILATLLDSNIIVEEFPFQLFTHLVVSENKHFQKFENYHELLIKHKEDVIHNLGESKLLLAIELFPAIQDDPDNDILEEAYKILDTLGAHFPNTTQGLVFEVNLGAINFDYDIRGTKVTVDIAQKALETLSTKLKTDFSSDRYQKYDNYLGVMYEDLGSQLVDDLTSLNKILPNFGGQIISTFNSRDPTPSLSLFYKMEVLLNTFLSSSHIDLQKTIFCFPAYSVSSYEDKSSQTVTLPEKTKVESGKVIVNRDTSTLKLFKYFDQIIDRDTFIDIKIEYFDSTANEQRDSIRTIKLNVKDTTIAAAFEDRETLNSKIEFAINNEINVGFWSLESSPVIHLNTAAPKSENPFTDLRKFTSKKFAKKLLKNPGTAKEIVIKQVYENTQPDSASWLNTASWYWPTLQQHIKKPRPPDYLQFLLIPLFVLKVLLPVFIIALYVGVNTYHNDRFLKPLKVKLFGISVKFYTFLILDILFWLLLLFLFEYAWYEEDTGLGFSTRNFAILLLIVAALGRPIVKFIIKLFKLVGKPLKIKKIVKILPYLGEMLYYNVAEEEKEKFVAYMKPADADRQIYLDGGKSKKQENQEKEKRENQDFKIGQDALSGKDSSASKLQEKDKGVPGNENLEAPEKERNVDLVVPGLLLAFFRLLFIGVSVFLVWYFEFRPYGGVQGVDIDYRYIVVFFIFMLELLVITYAFFKEYYLYYITKLIARHV